MQQPTFFSGVIRLDTRQDIGTVDELIKRFRHIESVRRKLITRTRFQKKPNVSAISAETNLVDIRSVIRKIGVELENISFEVQCNKNEEYESLPDIGCMLRERCNTVKHKINTDDNAPMNQRPYRISATERCVIENEVQRMLKENVIQPSKSQWSSPVVLVKKEW
ncbi:transposon Ty3-I Gag-Pol polyprotein [Trichonephila clavata]|uniref:Transposon Ty3-I Gag-Pol polyprotein n=1 Tax=Trichonephila clavata TaxID=2740835 RepID=A0A8X6HNH8_TRICU|nr:transposon Ty3-I Gag-Pol polyprotein [Trichonephila clavata]